MFYWQDRVPSFPTVLLYKKWLWNNHCFKTFWIISFSPKNIYSFCPVSSRHKGNCFHWRTVKHVSHKHCEQMVWYLLPIANVIHLWINFYDTPTTKLEGVLGIMDSFCYYHYYGPWYLVDHLSAVPKTVVSRFVICKPPLASTCLCLGTLSQHRF